MGSGKLKTGKEQHSPADGALVAGVTGLETLGGRAGQRGVPVHAEGIVLAALLAPSTCSAAKQISGGEECSFRNNGSGFAGQAKIFHKIPSHGTLCGGLMCLHRAKLVRSLVKINFVSQNILILIRITTKL